MWHFESKYTVVISSYVSVVQESEVPEGRDIDIISDHIGQRRTADLTVQDSIYVVCSCYRATS